MMHVKSFSDFVNESWPVTSGKNANFLTSYVDPDHTPVLKPESIGYQRSMRMLHALEKGRMSQTDLAKLHDEGEVFDRGVKAGGKSSANYRSAFSYIVNKGYAKIEKEGTKVFYSITPEGKAQIHDIRGENLGKDTNII